MPNLIVKVPTATTPPLAGTESLYIVTAANADARVLVSDLLADRVIGTGGVNVTGTTIPANGIYESAPDVLSLATASTLRVSVSTSLVTVASGIGLTLTDGNLTLSEGAATITNTAALESALSVTSSATGANVAVITANALTDGSALYIASNSADTSARSLLNIAVTSSSATGAYCARLEQVAANAFMNLVATPAANTTAPISTLTTPGATYGFAQIDVNGAKKWVQLLEDPS